MKKSLYSGCGSDANVTTMIGKEDDSKQTLNTAPCFLNIMQHDMYPSMKIRPRNVYPPKKKANAATIQNVDSEVVQNDNLVVQYFDIEVVQEFDSEVVQEFDSEVIQEFDSEVIQEFDSEVIQDFGSKVVAQDVNSEVVQEFESEDVEYFDSEVVVENVDSEEVLNTASDDDADEENCEFILEPSTDSNDSVDEQNSEHIVEEGTDPSNVVQHDSTSYTFMEQNNDGPTEYKEVPLYEIGITFENPKDLKSGDLTNIGHDNMEVEQTLLLDSADKKAVDSTSLPSNIPCSKAISSLDTGTCQNTKVLPAIDPVNTEIVWLPEVTPKQNLQEFLNFSNQELKNKDEACVCNNKDSISAWIEKEKNKIKNTRTIAKAPQRVYKNKIIPAGVKPILDRYTISKKKICKQWLKHCCLPRAEQDRRLMEYVTSRINLNAVKESLEQIKNKISIISFQLSNMFESSEKKAQVLYKKYFDWLNGPHLRFTPATPSTVTNSNNQSFIVTSSQPENPLIKKLRQNTKLEALLKMGFVTNADVYKFLKLTNPPFRVETLYSVLLALSKKLPPEKLLKILDFCKRYVSDIKFRWMTADYKDNHFEARFAHWLSLKVRWPESIKDFLVSKNCKPVAKALVSLDLNDLEQAIGKQCCDYGKDDVKEIIHRLFHHPEDAIRIRSFVENSACSCNPKPVKHVESSKVTEQDPLMLESEERRTIDTSVGLRVTCNNTLERVYKAPSGPRLNSLKQALDKLKVDTNDEAHISAQVNRESELRHSVKNTISKLKNGETSVNTPALMKESSKIVTQKSGEKLVFGPVLERVIYLNKVLNIKNGTKVKLSGNKMAVIVKVSNLRGATVLIPISNIQRGAKVQAKKSSNNSRVIMRPRTVSKKSKLPETSNNQATTNDKRQKASTFMSYSKHRVAIPEPPSIPLGTSPRRKEAPEITERATRAHIMQVNVTSAPSSGKKLNPMQRLTDKTSTPSDESNIISSVKALMADIDNGYLHQEETAVRASLSRLVKRSLSQNQGKNKETDVQASLSRLVNRTLLQNQGKNISPMPGKRRPAILLAPKITPLQSSHIKTAEPPVKKRLLEQTGSKN